MTLSIENTNIALSALWLFKCRHFLKNRTLMLFDHSNIDTASAHLSLVSATMDVAACIGCCVRFSVIKDGRCPSLLCNEKTVKSTQIIKDRLCGYTGVIPKILLECSAVCCISSLGEVDVTDLVALLNERYKIINIMWPTDGRREPRDRPLVYRPNE